MEAPNSRIRGPPLSVNDPGSRGQTPSQAPLWSPHDWLTKLVRATAVAHLDRTPTTENFTNQSPLDWYGVFLSRGGVKFEDPWAR